MYQHDFFICIQMVDGVSGEFIQSHTQKSTKQWLLKKGVIYIYEQIYTNIFTYVSSRYLYNTYQSRNLPNNILYGRFPVPSIHHSVQPMQSSCFLPKRWLSNWADCQFLDHELVWRGYMASSLCMYCESTWVWWVGWKAYKYKVHRGSYVAAWRVLSDMLQKGSYKVSQPALVS